ncbi:hypothetical protein [Streptomyces sp. NPDC047123]|uniref:hypothetical protein n=1 Tax=Streptomyces sp. NPDC047123 TaxID=3155622 RepID=UPI0033DB1AED
MTPAETVVAQERMQFEAHAAVLGHLDDCGRCRIEDYCETGERLRRACRAAAAAVSHRDDGVVVDYAPLPRTDLTGLLLARRARPETIRTENATRARSRGGIGEGPPPSVPAHRLAGPPRED